MNFSLITLNTVNKISELKLFTPPFSYKSDSFTFGSAKGNSYGDFRQKLNTVYPNQKPEAVLRDVILNSDNKIGEGREKAVYRIPGVDNFVVGKIKGVESSQSEFKPLDAYLWRYNFSQPIADNGNDLIIMEKIKGSEHSLAYWAQKFIDIQTSENRLPAREQAELFLKQISEIADFPQESFVDLANKVKYISEKMIKFDYVNPNNMLIDSDSKKFNPIDLQFNSEFSEHFAPPYNTIQDIICSLCDSMLNVSYTKALDEDEAQELIDKTKQVIKKCKMGAEIAGLEDGRNNIDIVNKMRMDSDFYNFIGENGLISGLYAEFCEVYKDVL